MWFSAKPNLACLQAAVRKVFSAFLIISRYRFLPSLCAASDDLYSHVMNPVSLVTQQKTLFLFINSLLPHQMQIEPCIPWCLSSTMEMAAMCSLGPEERGMWAATLNLFCCNVKLYPDTVLIWGLFIHKDGKFYRFGSCCFSVRWFSAWTETVGWLGRSPMHKSLWPSGIMWVYLATPQELSMLESWVIGSWTLYNKCIRWNCAIDWHTSNLF